MKVKRLLIIALIAVILLGIAVQDTLIQAYVKLFNSSLEEYSESLLADSSIGSDKYGLWGVDVNHGGSVRITEKWFWYEASF